MSEIAEKPRKLLKKQTKMLLSLGSLKVRQAARRIRKWRRSGHRGRRCVLQLVDRLGRDDGAGGTDWMAKGDARAVGIDLCRIEFEFPGNGTSLGGKGFVRLDDVDILDSQTGRFENLAAGRVDPAMLVTSVRELHEKIGTVVCAGTNTDDIPTQLRIEKIILEHSRERPFPDETARLGTRPGCPGCPAVHRGTARRDVCASLTMLRKSPKKRFGRVISQTANPPAAEGPQHLPAEETTIKILAITLIREPHLPGVPALNFGK